MKQSFLSCVLLMLATDAWAHRLDEYLHATRISVATNRINLSIDLTPGVMIADELLIEIDQDRDGQISEEEIADYTQRVLKEIRIELDKKVLVPSLMKASFPSLHDVREGLGVIRIKAAALVGPLAAGKHILTLSDAHRPAISVYLVNALTPKNNSIKIIKQIRDELQKDYRLEFRLNSTPP